MAKAGSDNSDGLKNLDNLDVPMHVVRSSLAELEDIITRYEIKHTVKFMITSAFDKPFNKGSVPWKEGRLCRVRYLSNVVPAEYGPFVNVGKKQYDCKFGKQRKNLKPNNEDKQKNVTSYKIGCVSQIIIEEIIRFPEYAVNGKSTMHHRRTFSKYINNCFQLEKSGQASDLSWKREFHMLIGPLHEHKHDIGEPAGPHMKVDAVIKQRMEDLARSGIFAIDIIKDNLAHYVETTLFKGKTPPFKSNRRFYPLPRDIQNVISKVKKEKDIKPREKVFLTEVSSEEQAAVSNITGNLLFKPDQNVTHYEQIGQYVDNTSQVVTQYQEHPSNQYSTMVHLADNNQQTIIPQTETEVCIQTTPSISQPQTQSKSIATSYNTPRNQKDAKGKFQILLKQFNKIANTIEDEAHFKQLSAGLINLIFEAKPMIPESKMDEIFKEEPKVLIHPRRIREYRRKSPKTPNPRTPSIKQFENELDVSLAKLRKVTGKHWTDYYNTPATPDVKTAPKRKIPKQKVTYVSLVQPKEESSAIKNDVPAAEAPPIIKIGLIESTTPTAGTTRKQTYKQKPFRPVVVSKDEFKRLLNTKNIKVIKKSHQNAQSKDGGLTNVAENVNTDNKVTFHTTTGVNVIGSLSDVQVARTASSNPLDAITLPDDK